ncbi:hypothetical protein DL764_005777 [Monosporascus ibericus]|uniref:TauD/TfdA-like domain-containing protein n=1 Tax=Monosporascus ibericus TaxID=155417 RepID=A0A4Q4TBK6_9PEZI|nr:hypothetical protein DL764_005777 [Monosporascus ibericus]
MPSSDLPRAIRAVVRRSTNASDTNLRHLRLFSSGAEAATPGRSSRDPSGPLRRAAKLQILKPSSRTFSATRNTRAQSRDLVAPGGWKLDSSQAFSSTGALQLSHPELDSPRVLSRIWLRDACCCERCVDPSSGQKRFATCDIPDNPPIAEARKAEDGSLEVTWQNDFFTHDNHISIYPATQVESCLTGKRSTSLLAEPAYRPKLRLWDRAAMESLAPFYDYAEFVGGGADYYAASMTLQTHGLFFIRNVPHDEKAVERIAEQLGIIQHTFYGRTWNVVSKPSAENVAYTNSYLGLHSDLLYMKDPPRIQLLHCLKNSCEGGESLFSDGSRARMQVTVGDREARASLSKGLIQYWYTKNAYARARDRLVFPAFTFDVFWSPPFQNPAQPHFKGIEDMRVHQSWVRAIRLFKELLEAEEYQYQYKLNEGECAVFNNLRVLHGRREFDTSSGERWLKGTYVDNDSYRHKFLNEVLPHLKAELLAGEEPPTISEQAKEFHRRRLIAKGHRVSEPDDDTGKGESAHTS